MDDLQPTPHLFTNIAKKMIEQNKQNKLDKIFMNVAVEFSEMSHCVSYKVGAVAVKDNRIVATGINGTPKGMINCDDIFLGYNLETDRENHYKWSLTHEIHAEMNIIIFCAKNGIELNGATIYSTVQPCQECMKNLLQSGIVRIIYKYPYDKAIGSEYIQEYLKQNNIIVEKLCLE